MVWVPVNVSRYTPNQRPLLIREHPPSTQRTHRIQHPRQRNFFRSIPGNLRPPGLGNDALFHVYTPFLLPLASLSLSFSFSFHHASINQSWMFINITCVAFLYSFLKVSSSLHCLVPALTVNVLLRYACPSRRGLCFSLLFN